MSRPVRVSRSPEPADSTTPTGRARAFSTKSSRSSGQHLLTEHLAQVAGIAGQRGLRQQEQRQDLPTTWSTCLVVVPVVHRLHQVAQQLWAGEAGDRREDVEVVPPRPQESRMVPGPSSGRIGPPKRPSATGRPSPVLTPAPLSLPPAGDHGAVRRIGVEQPPWWVPSATTRPSRRKATRSTWSSTRGLEVVTTVVRPIRCPTAAEPRSGPRCGRPRKRSARPGTRISGSALSARASTSRWRWPPENDLPRSAIPRCRRPSGRASRMSSDDAVSRARRPRLRGRSRLVGRRDGRRRAPLRCRRDHDPRAGRPLAAQRGQGYAAQGHLVIPHLGRGQAQPVRKECRLVGLVADDRPSTDPGRTTQAGARVGEHGAGRGRGLGLLAARRGRASAASTRQTRARGDPAPDDLVGVLGGGAQRDHQERRVAVERDQLTGA